MDLRFRPIPQDPDQLLGFLRESFREIGNALGGIDLQKKGTSTVTGNLQVSTDLQKVNLVSAGLLDDPVAGACFVSARQAAQPGDILLRVFTNAFALSATPINLWWVAYGF